MNLSNNPTKIFEFKENIVQLITNELEKVIKFINIAVFKYIKRNINTLEDKLNNGVKVAIFTIFIIALYNNLII